MEIRGTAEGGSNCQVGLVNNLVAHCVADFFGVQWRIRTKIMNRLKNSGGSKSRHLSNVNRGYRRKNGNCQVVNVLLTAGVADSFLWRSVKKSRKKLNRLKNGEGWKLRQPSNENRGTIGGAVTVE
jgi:hypothetical protein